MAGLENKSRHVNTSSRLPINSSQHLQERLAEAARYALLRRLAPVLRHNMAGALQPLSMMATMLEKRLQKPDLDVALLARNSNQLNILAREATSSCMGMMSWLTPKPGDLVTLAAGIEDVASLVATELSFKGFNIVNETSDVQAMLPRSLTRNVLMSALLALTDATVVPATVTLSARLQGDEVVLAISLQLLHGELSPAGVLSYRKLEWTDVEALAAVEQVVMAHTADRIELRCPVVVETAVF